MVVGGAHGDGDDLVGVPVEKTQEAVVVQRQISHRVVCAGRVRAHQHGLSWAAESDREEGQPACCFVNGAMQLFSLFFETTGCIPGK